MNTADLFEAEPASPHPSGTRLALGAQAFVLHGFALPWVETLLKHVSLLEASAPFRRMRTPGGLEMSVALTNCGALGWTSDEHGYRYSPSDPLSGQPWPPLPAAFSELGLQAAAAAGFENFVPDACLVNCYAPGARLSLHQDRDERDYSAPIVSISLGAAAVFLFGGSKRTDRTQRVPLFHGDVVVWGGVDRLRFHGVSALKPQHHALLGGKRINLTLRKAG